jgi:glucokinase
MQGAYLGIDLGGTEIKAVVVGPGGDTLFSKRESTHAEQGRDAVLETLVGLIREATGRAGLPVLAAGLAIPGVLDPETGIIELLTNFTPEWGGFGLLEALQVQSDIPCFLVNDVRAATVAEQMWGAGKPYRDFICIAIGTGIGGGLVLNGEVYAGSRGAAGEIGHQTMVPDGPRCNCGNLGCLEALASGYAMARDAREAIATGDVDLAQAVGTDEPTPEGLALAADQGNVTARAIFSRAGEHIGRALGNLVCALNPEAVVVGGGIAMAGELLLRPIREEIERRTVVFTPRRGGVALHLSPLGGRAGALGAAAWAMKRSGGERAK